MTGAAQKRQPVRRWSRVETVIYFVTRSPKAVAEWQRQLAEADPDVRQRDSDSSLLGHFVADLALEATYPKKSFGQDVNRVARLVEAAERRFDEAVASGRLVIDGEGRALVDAVKALWPPRGGPGKGRPNKRSHDAEDVRVLMAEYVQNQKPEGDKWHDHRDDIAGRMNSPSNYLKLRPVAIPAARYQTERLLQVEKVPPKEIDQMVSLGQIDTPMADHLRRLWKFDAPEAETRLRDIDSWDTRPGRPRRAKSKL